MKIMQKKLLEMGIGPKTPYPRDSHIVQLFEEVVRKSGSNIALSGEEGILSYDQLNRKANQLARHLQKMGVKKGDFVGISLQRSLNLVPGILGILKAGAVYVPIDQSYPLERKLLMIDDTQLKVLITQQSFVSQFPENLHFVCLDGEEIEGPAENLDVDIDPLDLAYINYTSGSTGKPKGVEICHRGVIRLVRNTNWINITAADRFLQMSNISFDALTFEVWGALLHGASLHIFPPIDFSPEDLGKFLIREKVTHALFAARLFTVMVEDQIESLKGLRYLLAGGDVFPAKQAKTAFKALPKCQLINAYGPTENTTMTTAYLIKDLGSIEKEVPIGRPISNTTVYIVDEEQKLVPVGVPGELYTGGDGIARGYLNRKDLTAEKFVPNPFGDGVLYRTGDLVSYLPDGNISFLGRIDNQVKIRGFRIELGEIEELFRHHPKIADCAAIAREDSPGDKKIVAYLLLREGEKTNQEELRAFATEKLPAYMVPSFFMILEEFPLSPTGKVDRKAFPVPKIESGEKIVCKTATEKTVAEIWKQILHLKAIGAGDHFFKLGGDSIAAMQIISRLKKEKIQASVHMLFEFPVLADFASHIDSQKQTAHGVIHKREIHSPVLLSKNQESMWLVNCLMLDSIAYSLPLGFRLKGEIDLPRLEQSLGKVIQRHESLRTIFQEKDREAYQFIEEKIHGYFHVMEAASEKEAIALLNKKAKIPFQLGKAPLFRCEIIRVGLDEYFCLINIHHIIFDGWSSEVFFNEWASFYAGKKLPDLVLQYGDFALWQRSYLETKSVENQLNYWKKQLASAPDLLELPYDHPRPPKFSGNGDSQSLVLSEDVTAALGKVAQAQGATLFVFLLAVYKVLLYRYSGKDDLVIGTPYANRNRSELEPMIGYFVQMLMIRSQISGESSFATFLEQENQVISEAFKNGDIPIDTLVAELNPARNPSYNPLFQVSFAFENVVQAFLDLERVHAESIQLENKTAMFDLHLRIRPEGKRLRCHIEFCVDLFEKETIQRMLRNFETLLKGILANPNEKIDLLPLLTKEDLHQITIEWNETATSYPREQAIVPLFEEMVEKYPNHIALIFLNSSMTYAELNVKTNQLARHLQKIGVKKGDFVGISLDRSSNLIIGILAILKVGGVYVPIDHSYPLERKHFMIEDAKIALLLTQTSFAAQFPDLELICLDELDFTSYEKKNLGVQTDPLDLVYINYTSGSTGRPKGVEVCHRGVIRLVRGTDWIEIGPHDRFSQMANISFDATTFEIWGALLNGATLCIFPPIEFSPQDMGHFLFREKVTHAFLTTRLFNVMVEEQVDDLKGIRFLLFGGEQVSTRHAKMAFESLPNCQILHVYGPTENTTYTTVYPIQTTPTSEVPIGKPLSNTTVFVLDKTRHPVPIGVPGELYTGGDGLAKGYLHQKELTQEKFVPNPFGKGRLYRTGDLVTFLSDGNIVFRGRIDSQVKIRGFRIELGEIEEVIRGYLKVADCIALAREDTPGEKRLVAYVEPKEGQTMSSEELQQFVVGLMPAYMIPSFFIVLEKFPITPNGKIDRKALPSPLQALETRAFEAPKTPSEQMIADTWSLLLKIPQIGRKDNFFKLGGHSITAAQLSSLVSTEFGIQVPVGLIFEESTLDSYAKKIDQLTSQIGGKQAITTRELFWIWRTRECVLDISIQPEGPQPDANQYKHPKKIFLTGSTGFVGAFFLRDLIEKSKAKIYCHIRAKNEKEGLARLKEVLEKYLIWSPEFTARIAIVPGDLEKPLLGIDQKQFEQLAAEIDSIFHIGAFVNHALPYEKLKAANVLGTEEALRLACKTRIKPFHFISTAAVVEVKSSRPIEEDIDLRECKNLFNGYAQSKWVGEKLVMIARSRGLPASIYRLARVSGDSRVGSGPTGDFLWRVVQASLRMQMAPQIEYREDVTPVDYVCEALRVISTKPEEINQQFHLLNPQFYYYKEIFKILKSLGYPLEMTDFETWRKTLVKMAIDTGEAELRALMPLFSEIDLSQTGDPMTFAYDHVTKALKGTDVKCPKVDEKLFRKYIEYYVRIGFLPQNRI